MEQPEKKIWKIRTVKDYAGAHNHILVGRVLEVNQSYIRLHCRSYHYGQNLTTCRDVEEGVLMVRILPWQRIEIINELSGAFGYAQAKLTADRDEGVILHDGVYACSLGFQPNKRY